MRSDGSRMRAFVVATASALAGVVVVAAGPASPHQVAQQGAINQTVQPKPDPPKGTGFLMGVIVDAAGKKPVGGAIVTITGGPPVSMTLPTGEVVQTSNQGTPDAPRQILTGPEGQFLFRALSAGRYQIRVSAAGYLAGSYGQLRPGGSSQSVELVRDDEKRGDLSIRMWKTATVSGTVVDEVGDPVIGIQIRLFRRTLVNGKPRFLTTANYTTDDRGIYRIPNLTPADYVVGIMSTQTTFPAATADAYRQEMSAGGSSLENPIYRELSSSGAPFPSQSGFRVGDFILSSGGVSGRGGGAGMSPPPADDNRVLAYPTVFYPAARTAAQAGVITVASGEDRGSIDIQLKLVPTVRVSGVVTGPDGTGKNLGVKLVPVGADDFNSESGLEAALTATDANGTFVFLGVTPGQYVLKCLRVPRPVSTSFESSMSIEIIGAGGMTMVSSGSGVSVAPIPPLPVDPTLWATVPVNVGETDLAGIGVTLRPGMKISGRLVFEGTKEQPTSDQIQRATLAINPMPGSAPVQLNSGPKRIEADGQFATIGYPPGKYVVGALLTGPAAVNWRFKSAVLGGRDLSVDGLSIEGGDVSGIVITFTDKTSDVSGTVTDAKGQPDRTASVIVIPADSQAWKQDAFNVRRLRNVRASTTGAFSFADLPAGAYFIAAVSEEGLENWQDPKTLEAIVRVATRFTLGDGEKMTQALTTRSIR